MKHTLVLVGCGAAKLPHAAPACELYTGQLFHFGRQWAERFGTTWRILSAKYGIVDPQRVIEPYDRTLRGLGRDLIRQWASWCQCDLINVMREMGIVEHRGTYLNYPRVIVLAGNDYVNPLLKYTQLRHFLDRVETPLAGLGIGQQMSFLSRAVHDEPQLVAAARQLDLFL